MSSIQYQGHPISHLKNSNMDFLLINLLLLGVIVVLLIILSWLWPPDSPWAPWWATKNKQIREALKLAEVTKDDIVYDLGCGDGRVLIIAAKEFGARGIGIEIDPLRFFISSILLRSSGVWDKVQIRRKNFFDEDLSSASVVFVYLVPKALNRLLPKFKKELKKGTRIVSYRYEAPLSIKKFDKEHNLRLYVI